LGVLAQGQEAPPTPRQDEPTAPDLDPSNRPRTPLTDVEIREGIVRNLEREIELLNRRRDRITAEDPDSPRLAELDTEIEERVAGVENAKAILERVRTGEQVPLFE
jgi:hypothetical protein